VTFVEPQLILEPVAVPAFKPLCVAVELPEPISGPECVGHFHSFEDAPSAQLCEDLFDVFGHDAGSFLVVTVFACSQFLTALTSER
jgi:hypothetical protein